MLVLIMRTDKPEAELALYQDQELLIHETWLAHRQLAETIYSKINGMLVRVNKKLNDIEGLVIFEGPGSFTGLRIGFAVANALAFSLSIPIVAAGGDGWCERGIGKLLKKDHQKIVTPVYGGEIHVSQPKK